MNIKTVAVTLPPLEEQMELIRRVDELFDNATKILVEIDRAAKLLSRVGQSALAKAFRGELGQLIKVIT